MTERILGIWRGEFVQAAWLITAAAVGCVLPLDFLLQIDGYLMYLRPWEIIPVYGWAASVYFLVGLIVSLVILIGSVCVGALLKYNSSKNVQFVGRWLATFLVLHEVTRSAKIWLIKLDYHYLTRILEATRWELDLVILIACAIVVVRRPKLFATVFSLLKVNASVALGVSGITLSSALSPVFQSPHANKQAAAQSLKLSKPDIILITMDAFSSEHLHLYGYPRQTTPYLDQLARQATVFNRFYANSNFTIPTTTSILHGVQPWTHRVNQVWARADKTLAEQGLIPRLHEAGYQTLVVSTNMLASLVHSRLAGNLDHITSPKIHVSEGLILGPLGLVSYYANPVIQLVRIKILLDTLDQLLVRFGYWSATDHFDPELAISCSRQLIHDRDDRPMFLWIHLLPPHAPYAAPPPYSGRFEVNQQHRSRFDSTPLYEFEALNDKDFPDQYLGRYDEAIAYVDNNVGYFLNWLKSEQLFDPALLIVSADHGENFSHGYSTHGGPLLSEGVIHIPLIIKEPGQTLGSRLDTLSEQIDLMPTILDLAGIRPSDSIEGRSLAPALGGQRMEGPVFSMNFEQNSRFKELTTGSIAMIEDHWKYVHYMGPIHYPMMPKLVDSLYDLTPDPGEDMNLITQQPAIAAKMLAAIEEQLRIHGKALP